MYKDSWEVGGSIIPLLFSVLHAVSDRISPISKTKLMYFFIPLIPFLILTRKAGSTDGSPPFRVLQKGAPFWKRPDIFGWKLTERTRPAMGELNRFGCCVWTVLKGPPRMPLHGRIPGCSRDNDGSFPCHYDRSLRAKISFGQCSAKALFTGSFSSSSSQTLLRNEPVLICWNWNPCLCYKSPDRSSNRLCWHKRT